MIETLWQFSSFTESKMTYIHGNILQYPDWNNIADMIAGAESSAVRVKGDIILQLALHIAAEHCLNGNFPKIERVLFMHHGDERRVFDS